MNAAPFVAAWLLLAAVPLWLAVAVNGPGMFAVGLLLAAVVSLPGLLLAVFLLMRRGIQLVRRRYAEKLPVLFKAAFAVHALAVLAFPVHAVTSQALESRRAHGLVSSVTRDVNACAREAMASYPRADEVRPEEADQPPDALAQARTVVLSQAALACLHRHRRDLGDCLGGEPVCDVSPGRASPRRGGLVLNMAPALLAEHDRLSRVAQRRGVAPPAALDPYWVPSHHPAVRFAYSP